MTHVIVNMEPADFYQGQTDAYLAGYNVKICGNDYTPTTHQTIRNLFAPPGTLGYPDPRPVFVAVNCISNSPSHAYRQVLLMDFYNGGGAQDFSTQMANFRNIIDSVQAPPPRLTNVSFNAGTFQFTFPGQRGRTNRVEYSTDYADWITVTNVFGTNAPITFRDTNVLDNPQRIYRVRRL